MSEYFLFQGFQRVDETVVLVNDCKRKIVKFGKDNL